jgi:hypothetical protein
MHPISNDSRLKILVAGSRTITEYNLLGKALTEAIATGVIIPATSYEIVSGGAYGVDSLARRYAKEFGYLYTEMKPIYQHNGDRSAPLRRNIDMAEYSDVLVAVWDGVSTGTGHMIHAMKDRRKPVYVLNIK